jgi:hypothetical protein
MGLRSLTTRFNPSIVGCAAVLAMRVEQTLFLLGSNITLQRFDLSFDEDLRLLRHCDCLDRMD